MTSDDVSPGRIGKFRFKDGGWRMEGRGWRVEGAGVGCGAAGASYCIGNAYRGAVVCTRADDTM